MEFFRCVMEPYEYKHSFYPVVISRYLSFKVMCEVTPLWKLLWKISFHPFGIFLGTVPCFLLGTEPAHDMSMLEPGTRFQDE